MQLDRIDLRILDCLQHDGRLTNQELAERVSLSPSPCLRRVRRLEEAGVISRYVALLDAQALGLGLLAYVNVKLEKRALAQGGRYAFDDFRDAVRDWPEVLACYATTGDSDYLMRVHVRDLAHFSRFVMDTLLKYPGVLDVRSSFALERIKDTTALPLPEPGRQAG
ncbi:MAG: Lrp/AsnC family transcriptional regulator [Burkholderiales bacterium]|nr:MAG: Lrp/AsnC family transcriptional regulator [Burkholderiales bacterium]